MRRAAPLGGAITESFAPAERAVLDTSVIIADQVAPMPGADAIGAITLAEVSFSVLVAKTTGVRAERLRRLSLLHQALRPLLVDEVVSASKGLLAAAVIYADKRTRRRVMDQLIVATAHAHDERAYTRNVRDLAGLEGLVDVIEVSRRDPGRGSRSIAPAGSAT